MVHGHSPHRLRAPGPLLLSGHGGCVRLRRTMDDLWSDDPLLKAIKEKPAPVFPHVQTKHEDRTACELQ